MFRIAIDGNVIRGLLYSKRRSAVATANRLQHVYGMNATVTTRKPKEAGDVRQYR